MVVIYIDYSKLWKLLIDKNISKVELMEITGISSRVLAKLSKNQTVTTETVARICAALKCDVGDIMECAEDEKLSLYNYYKQFGKCVEENDLYRKIVFQRNDKEYVVFVTKKKAVKATHIECKDDGTVYWVQYYPFGGMSCPGREEYPVIKPSVERNKVQIVLISGKPGSINGLDEGVFVSSRGKSKDPCVFVMSETAFKLFEV